MDRLSAPNLSQFSGTIFVTVLLVIAFQLELLLLSLGEIGHPYNLLGQQELPSILNVVLFLLAPILHVSASHLFANLVVFVPLSVLFERWSDTLYYIEFIAVTGWLVNVGIPFAGNAIGLSIPLSIGMSGVNRALAAHEVIMQGHFLFYERDEWSWPELLHLILPAAYVLYAVMGIIQPEYRLFVSSEAHTYGLLLGSVIALYRLR